MSKPVENTKNQKYLFSDAEIKILLKTKQDFLDGKTTARDWADIEEDLNRLYNTDLPKSV
jgi:hypothetical protein